MKNGRFSTLHADPSQSLQLLVANPTGLEVVQLLSRL